MRRLGIWAFWGAYVVKVEEGGGRGRCGCGPTTPDNCSVTRHASRVGAESSPMHGCSTLQVIQIYSLAHMYETMTDCACIAQEEPFLLRACKKHWIEIRPWN